MGCCRAGRASLTWSGDRGVQIMIQRKENTAFSHINQFASS